MGHEDRKHTEQPVKRLEPGTAQPPTPEPPPHPAVCGRLEFIRGEYRLVEIRDLVQ